MHADVAIVVALDDEFKAVKRQAELVYKINWSELHSTATIRTYQIAEHNGITIALPHASGMGQLNAAMLAVDVVADLAPAAILLVGIAAGYPPEVKLGDVLIADRVIDYELGKVTDEKTMLQKQQPSLSRELIAKLDSFKLGKWYETLSEDRPDKMGKEAIQCHKGGFLSGNKVVASEEAVEKLMGDIPKMVGIEMEAAGIAMALDNLSADQTMFAVVKGVSDRADTKKNDLWRVYAAHAAAAFALEFLNSTHADFLKQRRVDASQRALRRIQRAFENVAIPNRGGAEFRKALVENIVKATLEEIDGILKGEYKANVSMAEHFLRRAEPLFGKADTLYATSLDCVSTFWTDPESRAAAERYLKHQAPNGRAARLFVFSTPDAAHNHAKVLDVHAGQYKHVFVCSMEHYRDKIVPKVLTAAGSRAFRNRDFAALGYGCDHHILAELDAHNLRYRPLSINGYDEHVCFPQLAELFSTWMQARPGSFCGSDRAVLYWSPGAWNGLKNWAVQLKKLFAERVRTPDAIHMVFFRAEDPNSEADLRDWLAEIKTDIMVTRDAGGLSLSEKYRIKDMWIGQKVGIQNVVDKKYGGRIQATSQHVEPFVLVMKFEDEKGLDNFYQDEKHSEIRKKIFERLDPRLKKLYSLTPTSSARRGDDLMYEAIEAIASKHIHRRDYLEDEAVEQMVQTIAPYEPILHEIEP